MSRIALAAIMLVAMTGSSAFAATRPAAKLASANVENGKAVFERWCSACHAPKASLAGTLALQTKYNGEVPAALEQRTDLTPDVVAFFVRNGVAWMAPFRKTEISDIELADLGAYLAKGPAKRTDAKRKDAKRKDKAR